MGNELTQQKKARGEILDRYSGACRPRVLFVRRKYTGFCCHQQLIWHAHLKFAVMFDFSHVIRRASALGHMASRRDVSRRGFLLSVQGNTPMTYCSVKPRLQLCEGDWMGAKGSQQWQGLTIDIGRHLALGHGPRSQIRSQMGCSALVGSS